MKRSRFVAHAQDSEEQGACSPQITSLLDIMTILLIFLLKSFSTEGNIITPSNDLELPISTSRIDPELRTTVKITKTAVLFNDSALVANSTIERSDDYLIRKLYNRLQNIPKTDPDSLKAREMMLQADKDVEFNIIKRVMYTCSKAGYSDFTVLVMRED